MSLHPPANTPSGAAVDILTRTVVKDLSVLAASLKNLLRLAAFITSGKPGALQSQISMVSPSAVNSQG